MIIAKTEGIIITKTDMEEIPQTCGDCDIKLYSEEEGWYCPVTLYIVDFWLKNKHCPLVEVQE